jgi:serine protease Do
MKKQPLAWLAVATLTAGTALAQDNPPPPPAPPAPPHAAGPPADHQGPPPGPDGMQPGPDGSEHGRLPRPLRGGPGHHREAGLLLGVGVEELPHALSDQLSLPDGFGVLVNFVVPGSAAEAAGVQPDDVLKMLNDQILVNPEQLSTLVHSYSDGQEVTLTAIRKDKEVKLTAKLKKEPLPPGHEHFGAPGRDGEGREMQREGERERQMHEGNEGREQAFGDREQAYRDLGPAYQDGNHFGPPGPPAPPVRDIMRELRPELKELGEAANQKAVEKLQREITILRERDGGSRSTKLDLQDARIVIRDDKGELELKSDAGKRSLTAKDPQGKVLFSGPVNTPDERKAVPGDILPRLEKLEKEEMPAFPEAPKADAATTSANSNPDAPLSAATF